MHPLLLLGLAGGAYLLSKRNTVTPVAPVNLVNNQPVRIPTVSSGGAPSTSTLKSGLSLAGGAASAATAAATAASSGTLGAAAVGSLAVPIIGAVIGGAIAAIGLIYGHHQAAIAAEANDLNTAVPAMAQSLQAIFQLVNTKQVDTTQAKTLIDDAVANYYKAVATIINSGGHPCGIDPNTCDSPKTAGGLPTFMPCNGPCTVGCVWIEPWACKAKKAFLAHGTTVQFASIPSHSGFNGFQGFTLTYN